MVCYNARWIIPVTSAPIENGTVAVVNGKIAYAGPRTGAPQGDQVELGDALILPGLVNAHTHLELTVMRGFLEDLSFVDWIGKLRRGRNEVLTNENLLDSARLGINEGIRAGVTCYADTCSTGVSMQAMREAGVRGIMYQEVFAPAPEGAEAALADLVARIDTLEKEVTGLVALGVSPHAPYTVSEKLYGAVSELSRKRRLPVAMHIAESAEEDDLVRNGAGPFADLWIRRGITPPTKGHNRSPVALLDRYGLLREDALLIHAVRADTEDIDLIAAHNCAVVHCPISNAKLGHGVAPLTAILARKIRTGLGSDSMASNNRMDMLEEARTALLFQRAHSRKHDAISAAGALALATIGGAQALGLDKRIGSLEAGKDADIAAFAITHDKALPGSDPIATAVFALGGTDAILTVVEGRELLRHGRIANEDPALRIRCTVTGAALASWSSANGF
ncbi:MAG: amidohydrolase family protein [Gemmatimonadaceae bacterium]|nr:amidohydrolase family protein [Gemmatimonadaceae bacterium]